MKTIIKILLLAGLLIFTGGAQAMGEMTMFSALSGRVTEQGKPVVGAQVLRHFKWGWNGKEGGDETRTDAEGRFAFTAIKRFSLLGSLLPHEPAVDQTLSIVYGGKSYVAWEFTRDSYRDNAELFGRPIKLDCELNHAPQPHQLESNYVRHSVYGICAIQGVDDLVQKP